MAGAVGVHIDAHGLGNANGIGHLHEHLVGYAGSHRILCHVACGIGSAAVHLAGILAAEGATAVCSTAAIGVDDNLAAGQASVAMRTANHKLAGGVHVQLVLIVKPVEEALYVLGQTAYHAWQQDVGHVLLDALHHLSVGLFLADAVGLDKLVVLSADDDGVDTHGAMGGLVILYCHLALGVGAQIRNLVALAQRCQLAQQGVGKVERERHVIRCLVARVAKHHALVASALSLLTVAVHTAVNVVALLMQRREHAARVAVKLVLTLGVTNLVDHLARNLHQVDVGLALHLAGNHHLASGHESLACHTAAGVKSQEMVEQRIANLVGNFVGMTFRHRLTGK